MPAENPLVFVPRRATPQPTHPPSHELAGKLQRLLLECPYEARIIEAAINKCLAKLPPLDN